MKKSIIDRISQGYKGELGADFQKEVIKRIEWICNNSTGEKILDVGCSQGITSILLGEKGKNVVGIDIERECIEYAEKDKDIKNLEGVKFLCDDFLTYNFDEKFDCIIMGEILEHIYSPGLFLDKSKELLKDNGRLIVTVPFGINPFPDHKRTYYFAELFEQINQRIPVTEVFFFGQWIGYIADNKDENNNIIVDCNLIYRLEDAFFQIEEKKDNFIQELKDKIINISAEKDQYLKDNDKFQNDINKLIEKNDRIVKENEEIAIKFEEMNKTALRLKKENEIISNKNEELKKENIILKEKKSELELQNDNLRQENNIVEIKFEEMNKTALRVKKENELIASKKSELEKETEIQKIENNNLKKEVEEEKEKGKNREIHITELNNEIDSLKDEIRIKTNELLNIKEEIEKLKIDFDETNSVSYKRRKSLEELQKKFEEMNTVAYQGKKTIQTLKKQLELFYDGYKFYREAYENLLALRGIKLWMKSREIIGRPYQIAYKNINYIEVKTDNNNQKKELSVVKDNKIATSEEKYAKYNEKSINKSFYESLEELTKNISDSNGSSYYQKANINVGIITDEFMYNYYKDAVNLHYISPDNYKEEIDSGNLDFILFVSCWHGMFGREDYSGEHKRKHLCDMLKYAKAHGVTIVFQTIEDPTNYNVFINIAREADYIFTTDVNMIEQYKKDTGNDKVYYLGYGINPQFHNPIGSFAKRKKENNSIFFAGSWADRYPERCRDMKLLFDGVIKTGNHNLVIADRNMNINGYEFPDEYSKYLIPPIDHALLQKVHKLFDFTINLNTITNSPTMCAMRVYEIQALGGLLISNYALAVSNTFPGVFTVTSENEIGEIVNNYSESELVAMQLDGIRDVYSNYTVFDRLNYIFGEIGINYEFCNKKVYVIYDELTDNIQKSFNIQSYKNIELMDKTTFCNLDCNDGYAILFEDKIYSQNYILDLINATKYTDTEYINYCDYKEYNDAFEYTNYSNSHYGTLYNLQKVLPNKIMDIDLKLKDGFTIPYVENNNVITKKEKELAVIIPTYNNGKYLKDRAIRSLFRSSIFDSMQIYIIDDGSDEETIEYIREIENKYDNVTTYFFNDGGSGSASRPRNKGFEISTEPFVTYLDPDNEAVNDGYRKLLSIVKEQNVDFAFGYINKIDSTVQPLCFRYESFLIDNPRAELIGNKFKTNSIQACVIKRELIEKNNIKSPEGAIGQDTMFFYELMLNARKAYHLYEPIHIYYAERTSSVVNTIGKSFFDKSILMERYQVTKLKEYGVIDQYKKIKLNQFVDGWYKEKLKSVSDAEREYCNNIVNQITQMYM